jgi:hypothetical protein
MIQGVNDGVALFVIFAGVVVFFGFFSREV